MSKQLSWDNSPPWDKWNTHLWRAGLRFLVLLFVILGPNRVPD